MTTSCSTWVPLEVSCTTQRLHGDSSNDIEVNQLIYVKRTEAAAYERKLSSGFQHEIKADRLIPNEDKSVVWPPTVILQNIRLDWDKDEKKWKGMKREEICRSLRGSGLSSIHLRVKCLYDFNGQKGCALVIFPKTAEGYLEAEALDRRMDKMSRGRLEWARVKPKNQHQSTTSTRGSNTNNLICCQGERILYGYLATPEDMQRVDPHRKSVKWFTESLREKIGLLPRAPR